MADGVGQSGLVLTQGEAGNLDQVHVDLGAPPAGLPERKAIVGIELGDDEVLQIPLFLTATPDEGLVPRPSTFGGSTYRLTASAQTATGDAGAQSIVLRHGLTSVTLAAGTWLVPPTGVTASRTAASWTGITGGALNQATWTDASGDAVLQMTIFDPTIVSVEVPTLVALPTSGPLTFTAGGIAGDIDVQDVSLDADTDKIEGIATQPATIP